ncbi:helix-turn-helix domain-containing protein (plasmid) [Erwinia sp. E602]|uniref:helix-turn-helix domain-containing protein n=1 Tax=unclassified Erwinia TaxID=2622719 RepID=UPI0006FFA53F|nr:MULTISPECIES: helix-turn-helix domain-containing protein [unclassified Erwinia]KQN55403.1 hypothetical protein ASF13_07780 [Erwinia sp. Leaf53]QUG73488.1 helix-turn-helix domain-containing protein [Erwinia sp. E602]
MKSARNKITDAVIEGILPWIDKNLSDESIRVRTVTERSGYGHWHFQRLFRQGTGINLAAYIRLRRIARAAHLIAFTNKGMLEIAVENGFSCQQNFTRTFKSYFAITPTQFRRKYANRAEAFRILTEELYNHHELASSVKLSSAVNLTFTPRQQ